VIASADKPAAPSAREASAVRPDRTVIGGGGPTRLPRLPQVFFENKCPLSIFLSNK
jgi:hypothetical protein